MAAIEFVDDSCRLREKCPIENARPADGFASGDTSCSTLPGAFCSRPATPSCSRGAHLEPATVDLAPAISAAGSAIRQTGMHHGRSSGTSRKSNQRRARLGVVEVASIAVLASVSTFVAIVADRLAIVATAGRCSWGWHPIHCLLVASLTDF